jgi:hypothetical protein
MMKVLRLIMTSCDLNYSHGHWLLNNTLQFVITKIREVHDETINVVVPNNVGDEKAKAFDIELTKNHDSHEAPNVGSFSTFFFLHGFDKKKRHNVLALMLDPRFKNMWLVAYYFQVVKMHLRWSMNMILVYCCFCQWIITRC